MARKRMIDPSIWQDEGMAELSPRQQLLYIGLFSNADDAGRLKGTPAVIRMILPTLYAGCELSDIECDLDAVLRSMSQLMRYEVDGRSYLTFRNYPTWQKIQKPQPSVLPDPPFDAEFEPMNIPVQERSDSSHVPVQERSDSDPLQRKEVKGIEREEVDARTRAATTLREFGVSDGQIDRTLSVFTDDAMPSIALTAAKFITHWDGRDLKDHDRAWANWIKQEERFIRERRSREPPTRPLPKYLQPLPGNARERGPA